jgi:hypothetical protein
MEIGPDRLLGRLPGNRTAQSPVGPTGPGHQQQIFAPFADGYRTAAAFTICRSEPRNSADKSSPLILQHITREAVVRIATEAKEAGADLEFRGGRGLNSIGWHRGDGVGPNRHISHKVYYGIFISTILSVAYGQILDFSPAVA